MKNAKIRQQLTVGISIVLLISILLGVGWGMNIILLPEETLSAETTEPTQPPTDPPEPTVPALSVPDIELTAQHSFIYIPETGQFSMLKGQEDDKIYPASLTKLFSTYVERMSHNNNFFFGFYIFS